jgi:hypothetical protein
MLEDSLEMEFQSKRSVCVSAKASEVNEGALAGYQYKMDISLGALKSHPKMLFSMKLCKGRYQDLETFDRRKV